MSSCFLRLGSGSGIGSPPPRGMRVPCMTRLPCTWEDKESMMPRAGRRRSKLTLRAHPIGVNQTTCGDGDWAILAGGGTVVLLMQLLPPAAVWATGAEGKHRRRVHLPECGRDSRDGRLHVLRQP